MDWLQFVSDLIWPLVAVGTLLGFRSSIRNLLEKPLSKLKVGPIGAQWGETVDATVDALDRQATEKADKVATSTSALTLRLLEVANTSPVGAIIAAAVIIEEELWELSRTAEQFWLVQPGWSGYLHVLKQERILPESTYEILESLQTLRDIAESAPERASLTHAVEFLTVADRVLPDMRRVRWERERAISEIDAEGEEDHSG